MSTFHFKQFDVVNEASSMKVGTDGVLLGASATLCGSDRNVLDVGTGTGTIALMLAQRYPHPKPVITGIDIDGPSAAEAGLNFSLSPWTEKLSSRNCPLGRYFPEEKLDLIVSNPPYFEQSLLPPERRRGMARHASGDALTWESLVEFAEQNLSDRGRLSVILPADREKESVRYAVSCGLSPFRILRVRTTPRKQVSRVILEFSNDLAEKFSEEMLTLQDPSSFPENRCGYTPEYLKLVGDFYL